MAVSTALQLTAFLRLDLPLYLEILWDSLLRAEYTFSFLPSLIFKGLLLGNKGQLPQSAIFLCSLCLAPSHFAAYNLRPVMGSGRLFYATAFLGHRKIPFSQFAIFTGLFSPQIIKIVGSFPLGLSALCL